MAQQNQQSLGFESLHPALNARTLEGVKALGFVRMTPVQASTIPLFLTNKDVCVEAVTGSGKTLSFVIPAVEMILRRETPLKKHEIGAVIISPTRELAKQIYQVATHFCSHTDLKPPLLLVGGTDVGDNFQRFTSEGADIVVATPGRLSDLLERYQIFDLRELEVLILDEADTLLNMGFKPTLTSILSHMPKQRRTGLFSATQTREVRQLARAGLRNPATVSVQVLNQNTREVQATPQTLQNFYLLCKPEEKLALLLEFLKDHKDEKVMVFFITCAAVDYFSHVFLQHPDFKKLGLSDKVAGLHGKMVQKKRDGMYARFSSSPSGVLLCTDVAARGIDVPDVDWIIQYEPPQDPSFFIHRVGRTARAGRVGKSLTLLLEAEDPYVEFLRLKNVPLAPYQPPIQLAEGVAEAALTKAKQLAMTDREVLEKGTRAFTAFVRAYKEHQCQFIFRFAKLDLAAIARSYALLRLPKMPELAHHPIPVKFDDFGTDTRGITYKDKKREAARQKRLITQEEENKKEIEWKKEENEKATGRKKEEGDGVGEEKRLRKKRKGKHQQIVEEWEELGREERLYKRLRQHKITKEEYERELRKKGGSDDEEGSGQDSDEEDRGDDGEESGDEEDQQQMDDEDEEDDDDDDESDGSSSDEEEEKFHPKAKPASQQNGGKGMKRKVVVGRGGGKFNNKAGRGRGGHRSINHRKR